MDKKHFSQKQKLAVLKAAEQMGIQKAAETAGVHYTSVYDWKHRLEALGEEGFLAYEPAIPGRGIKEISPKKEEAILTTWERNRGLGPGQVRNQLRRQGMPVSIGTVRKIMEANGYKPPRKTATGKEESKRFEARRPLELAQMDILELFIHKLKVYLLVLLDDFSRFILGFRLLTQTSIDEVIGLVQESIDRYGKMEEMLTDRGFVFYSWQGSNRFEKYLEVEGIDHIHASAHHPQTLGKIEALNGHLRREVLEQEHFPSMQEAKGCISRWVFQYNYERTHQGLGGLLVPADRFHGMTDLILSHLEKGIDLRGDNGYPFRSVERSILNVVVGPEGGVSLYLLGQPIALKIGR
jgi:putative transposase